MGIDTIKRVAVGRTDLKCREHCLVLIKLGGLAKSRADSNRGSGDALLESDTVETCIAIVGDGIAH